MRRLLVAAAVLLAGPAQAVDYVKCEAMTRAYNTQTRQHSEIVKDRSYEFMHAFCTKRFPSFDKDWANCYDGEAKEAWIQEKVRLENDLSKVTLQILNDLKKENCPQFKTLLVR